MMKMEAMRKCKLSAAPPPDPQLTSSSRLTAFIMEEELAKETGSIQCGKSHYMSVKGMTGRVLTNGG